MRRASRAGLKRAASLALVACAGACAAPARLLEETGVAPRGHQELVLVGASILPWALGRDTPVGVCLDPGATRDTSEWVGRITFGGERPEGDFSGASQRLGATLCFEHAVPADLADGETDLCLDVRDDYDGVTDRACLRFRFDRDDAEHRRLEDEMKSTLSNAGRDPVDDVTAALDALGSEARSRSFPFLELRLRLISVYLLRRAGSAEALAEAEERAADAPSWLSDPVAAAWAAQVAYERATLALGAGELERAWSELRDSERGFRAVADPKWIVAASRQVEILSRVGALGEAREKLRFALDQCSTAPCDARLVGAARNTLSWLVLVDPDADGPELEGAAAALDEVLASMGDRAGDVERANVLVNLGYARERLGLDPGPELARARELLDETSELARWSGLIDGLHALRTGDVRRAIDACDDVLGASGAARLRAWAASCSASALDRAGDLDRAADRLALAWILSERAAGSGIDQTIPIGPGQLAETAYRAARVAVERGRPAEAWQALARLDRVAVEAPPAATGERESLLAELAELEAPATPARRAQREPILRATLGRLQELLRAGSAVVDGAGTIRDAGVTFRAFAVDDEVVLLKRSLDGSPTVYRRTALPRVELLHGVRALTEAMETRDPDDSRWRETARPLARALVPDRADLVTGTTFALHGILQSVPLHALPLPGEDGWLGDLTSASLHPAAAYERRAEPPDGPGIDLFVIDPGNNLPRRDAARTYRSLVPRAHVLQGAEATAAALASALADARSLHVDAHARYDSAFPELSTLELADGPVTAQQIAAHAGRLRLANLSACHSASWPVTADSGRFGIAGSLARQGVAWVVASRAELSDTLAADFNRAFYGSLAEDEDVPGAFRAALAAVQDRHPVSSWAALLLLRSGTEESGGQSAAQRTLLTSGSALGSVVRGGR